MMPPYWEKQTKKRAIQKEFFSFLLNIRLTIVQKCGIFDLKIHETFHEEKAVKAKEECL